MKWPLVTIALAISDLDDVSCSHSSEHNIYESWLTSPHDTVSVMFDIATDVSSCCSSRTSCHNMYNSMVPLV